jgi:Family of unknown function (DUF5757)
MFRINGRRVTLSPNDDYSSLKSKISAALGTLPQLLADDLSQVENGGNYTVRPPMFYLVDDATVKSRENLSIENVKSVPVEGELDLKFLTDLFVLSTIHNNIEELKSSVGEAQAVNYALMELEELGVSNPEDAWSKRVPVMDKFSRMVFDHRKRNENLEKTVHTWDSVSLKFSSGSVTYDKISYETEVSNVRGKTELMVFDSVKLNDVAVACFYGDMVKYNPAHTDLVDAYLDDQDDQKSKSLKTADVVRIMISRSTKFMMVNVFVSEELLTLGIQSSMNELREAATLKNIIKNILFDMGESEVYDSRREREFYSLSYEAAVTVPTLVIKELATNDPNLMGWCYLNESSLINTRSVTVNLFLKKFHDREQGSRKPSKEDVGVSLFERPDTVGTFVKIKKVRGDLDTEIKFMVERINKILQYSFDRIDEVLRLYRSYNVVASYTPYRPPPTPKAKGTDDGDGNLRRQVPEIFLSNYTRLCNKPPVIVAVANDKDDDDPKIMKFPVHGETDPKMYRCDHKDYPYPGLRKNTKLPNMDVFPYVPCCYQRPQKDSKNFKLYFNQETTDQRINSKEIGKTMKILAKNRVGALPPKIDKLFNYTTDMKFYRYGVQQSVDSCLTVLNMVTGNDASVGTVRRELASRAELCKGELSGSSVVEIAAMLKNPKIHVNPKIFKGALEDYYNISYVLFSMAEDDFSEYPSRFKRFVCPLKPRVVFLVVHDEHVELVVDENTLNLVNKSGKKPTLYYKNSSLPVKKMFVAYKERFKHVLFDNDSKTLKAVHDHKTYPWEYASANGKIHEHVEPLSQYVDSLGQTRLVEFNKDGEFSFVGQFEPLPCLRLPIRSIDHFVDVNAQLTAPRVDRLRAEFPWLTLYSDASSQHGDSAAGKRYPEFKQMKRLAEYLLWAACHLYAKSYAAKTTVSVDEWIAKETVVLAAYDLAYK